MSDGTITYTSGSGGALDAEDVTYGSAPTLRKRERMQLAGDIAAAIAEVLNAPPSTADYGLVTRTVGLPNQAGTWSYYAGASGTVNVSSSERVLGIATHALTAGSFTIDGGDSIPVPANTGIAIQPLGNLVGPTIVFSGTDSYFVEVVS